MGSPRDVETVPTRHLRDVFGSGVCYLGSEVIALHPQRGHDASSQEFHIRNCRGYAEKCIGRQHYHRL